MTIKALKLKAESTSLGTNVSLSTKDSSYTAKLAEYLETDPSKNNKSKLKGGYLFRSPKITQDDWTETFKTLYSMDGNFSITAQVEIKKDAEPVVTAWARFEEQADAAMFAWSNVEVWQKWSDAQEEEARAEAKKTDSLKITKDGRLTGTVTVTTLGD